MERATDPKELRRRIEAVYQHYHEDDVLVRGALVWIADMVGVSNESVSRYVMGQTDPQRSEQGQRLLKYLTDYEGEYDV
jgi:hypothetical protein